LRNMNDCRGSSRRRMRSHEERPVRTKFRKVPVMALWLYNIHCVWMLQVQVHRRNLVFFCTTCTLYRIHTHIIVY
jgi:hypothetical protein